MPAPTISIVTPVLNGAQFIEETIRSVLDQDYPRIEYFIHDGGSSDHTVSLIKRYESRLSGWTSEPDQGQTDALNRALARTTGPILAWINADDFYQPGAFTAVAELFAAHPEAAAIAGAAWLTHPDGTRVLRRPHDLSRGGLLNWRRNWIAQPAVFFRRSAWQRVAPLDASLHWAMDFDLWLRLLDAGPMVPTDRVLAAFRQHARAKCYAAWPRMLEEARRVILRHATHDELGRLYADLHAESAKLDELCADLLLEHVRGRWARLEGEVILFGAGAHTPWLLGIVHGLAGPEVTAILDDHAEPGREIRGIPILHPDKLAAPPPTVVLSTDTLQETLARRCRELFGPSTRIVNLYEGFVPGPYPKSDTHRAAWR